MSRNLTVPTVIKELDRVSKDIGVNIFRDDVPVAELINKLAIQHAFREVPEIAGQMGLDNVLSGSDDEDDAAA